MIDCGRSPAKRTAGDLVEVSADIFRDGHETLRAAVRYRGPGERGLARGAHGARRRARGRRPLGGPLPGRPHGALAVRDRGLDGPLRLLARRARAQAGGRAARPGGRAVGGRAAHRRGGRARPGSRPLAHRARAAQPARGHPRGGQARRGPGRRALRRHRALLPAPRAGVAGRAAGARGRPRARPLRRLVRAVPALLGRLRRRGATPLPALAELGFDVALPAADPPDRRDQPQGPQQHADRRPRRSRQPVGDRRTATAATTRSTPSSARSEDFDALAWPRRASMGVEIALDFAIQCSADHPWLREHPEWFHRRPDGTLKYAENPPKKYQDIYNVDCRRPRTGAACGRRCATSCCSGSTTACAIFRVDNPHTKPLPFWEWLIARGPRRAPRRDLPGRGVHPPGDDARAGQARLRPVLHLLHLEEQPLGADRVRLGAGLLRGAASTSGPTSSPTRPTSCTPTSSTAGGPPSRRGSCWPPRSLPPTGSTRGSSTARTCRCARAPRSTWTPRSTRSRIARSTGRCCRWSSASTRVRRENPALQHLANVTFLETENDALIAYVKRTERQRRGVRGQPRSAIRRRRGSRSSPPSWDCPRSSPSPTCSTGERYEWRIGRQLRAPGARVRQAHLLRVEPCERPAHHRAADRPPAPVRPRPERREERPGNWFEADPLWFKTAVFYEIHVRGFFDGNDDGIGDFRGLTEKLDYLQWLGVDCIWLLPMYPSPLRDGGYDIADFTRDPPGLRDRRRLPRLRRGGPPARHPGHRRPRDEPHLRPTIRGSSAPAGPAGLAQARLVRVVGHGPALRRRPDHLHRHRVVQLDLGPGGRRLLLAPLLLPPARPQLRQPRGPGRDARRPALLARPGPRRLPPRRRALPLRARRDQLREPARDPRLSSSACAPRSTRSYPDRVLLAEANQWPADVVEYFGDGDECHMAFHFPVMPRMFMALRREERRARSSRSSTRRPDDPRQLPVGRSSCATTTS